MKQVLAKINLIFIIIITISSHTLANDISDFQIEGMSIGDSLLNYFNEDYILEEFEIGKNEYDWTDQKFTDVYKYGEVELYDNVNFKRHFNVRLSKTVRTLTAWMGGLSPLSVMDGLLFDDQRALEHVAIHSAPRRSERHPRVYRS